MFGLEDLPFPIRILIALVIDFLPGLLGAGPGAGALIQFLAAFILTGSIKLSLIAMADGFLGYINGDIAWWLPGTTLAVILNEKM